MIVNGVTHTYKRGDAYDCGSLNIGKKIKTNKKQKGNNHETL